MSRIWNWIRRSVGKARDVVWGFLMRWRQSGNPWMRRFFWTTALFSALFVPYNLYLFARISLRMDRYVWDVPSKVYAEPLTLFPDVDIEQVGLWQTLRTLGYWSVRETPTRPGEYVRGRSLTIYLRQREFAEGTESARRVRIRLSGNTVRDIAALEESGEIGERLSLVRLDPIPIARIYSNILEERDIVPMDELPKVAVDGIIAIEDKRYFGHLGLSPRGIARAFLANLRLGRVSEGGSTITQQMVKNLFLTHKRTLTRKINEALMAIMVELRYSKKRILNAYVNEIYLGQSGSVSISGIGAASRFYFGKDARGLTLGEAALLAGMIRSPYRYSPLNHPENARDRRRFVLSLLLEEKKITQEQFDAANREKIPTKAHPLPARSAPYLVDAIRKEIPMDAADLSKRGYRIYTGVDARLQRAAEDVVKDQAARLRQRDGSHPELAFVGMNPHTGQIAALVGGVNYGASQFNRIVDAVRQPGSAFKPIVYATALEQAYSGNRAWFTPATHLEDSPLVLTIGGKEWRPKNSHGDFLGQVTVRVALEDSLNIPAVRVAEQVGVKNVLRMARNLGIERDLPEVPSLAIGSGSLTPLELLGAYSAFAGEGVRVKPYVVRSVYDANGKEVYRHRAEYRRSLSPQTAYLLTHLLEGVIDRGTGASVRSWGFSRIAAGKTGTTNDGRDAWFVGYTPDLLALAWAGYDDNRPFGMTGARAALPTWVKAVSEGVKGRPARRFPTPPGIVFRRVDRSNGFLANPGCPTLEEAFVEGTEPTEYCTHHEVLPPPEEVVPESDVEFPFGEVVAAESESLSSSTDAILEPSLIPLLVGTLSADEIEANSIEAKIVYVRTLEVNQLDCDDIESYEDPPPSGGGSRGRVRDRAIAKEVIVAKRIYANYLKAEKVYAESVVHSGGGQ